MRNTSITKSNIQVCKKRCACTIAFSIYTSVLPHTARFANFSDFVLWFACRAVPGAAVCVLFARLPNVHEPVWPRVPQGSFNAFSSKVSPNARHRCS